MRWKITNTKGLPKWLIILIVIQILINCLHSLTIFPFYHYGMYSEVYKSKEITVFEIIVNGRIVEASNYDISTWDMINAPLISFKKQIETRDFAFDKNAMANGIGVIGLGKVFKEIKPNLNNSYQLHLKFPKWYKTYLENIVNYKIQILHINQVHYIYSNSKYKLRRKEEWLII